MHERAGSVQHDGIGGIRRMQSRETKPLDREVEGIGEGRGGNRDRVDGSDRSVDEGAGDAVSRDVGE